VSDFELGPIEAYPGRPRSRVGHFAGNALDQIRRDLPDVQALIFVRDPATGESHILTGGITADDEVWVLQALIEVVHGTNAQRRRDEGG